VALLHRAACDDGCHMSEGICKRCGKDAHGKERGCKAPFSKSWVSQPAMKILLRFPDGMTMDMTAPLTLDQFTRIEAVCREAWGIPAKSEAEAKMTP
jgi:hypothetical protein